MSYAPNYTPTTDFSQNEANNVSGRSTVRTANIDAELNNISTSINALNDNIKLLQRSDGEVKDGIIKMNSLSFAVKAALGNNPDSAELLEETLSETQTLRDEAEGFSESASTSATNASNSANNAATSEAITLAAQVAAEAARDSINTTGKVFTSTALGIAGTTDGQSFSVLSDDLLSWNVYKNNAGTALYLASSYTKGYLDLVINRTNDEFFINGVQVMYAVVDTNNRSVGYILMDGTFVGKLAVSGGNCVLFTRQSDGTYITKLDPAIMDNNFGCSDYLGGIIDSNNRAVFLIKPDGTLLGKFGIVGGNGVSFTKQSDGTYITRLDSNIIDNNYGGSDYLCAIVDSSNRIIFAIGMDGTITGKFTVAEIVSARGDRADLNTRLSQNTNNYGLPKSYIFGEWFLRETRMRLRKRALSESIQLNIAMIGDSWTHARDRYSNPVAATLKTAFGDAGAGWTGFAWGFGGTSDAWSGGNGNINSSDVSVALTTGWTAAYYTTASPDLGGISTATAGSKATVSYTGSGNVSAVVLFYTAGSGVLRYRWNGGAWTTLDISTGSGTQTASLASVPTGTWTLEIENVSGTTVVHGVDVQKTSSGVRAHKLGSTGSSTANWTGVNATQWQNALSALAPTLVTILLGTNDQGASMTPATYATNLQTLITRIKTALPYVDIAILMPCENQRTNNTYAMSLYAYEAYKLAAINKCAFLDLQYVFGDNAADYAYGTGRAWFAADLIHPDPQTGGRVIADAVYRLLTTV